MSNLNDAVARLESNIERRSTYKYSSDRDADIRLVLRAVRDIHSRELHHFEVEQENETLRAIVREALAAMTWPPPYDDPPASSVRAILSRGIPIVGHPSDDSPAD